MAFTNLPPNLQDIFYSITDRIAKLETGPNQAMDYAQGAQDTSAQALAAANLANTQATTAIALAGTKNTVFYSGTTPTANAVDDQWINTAQGNKLYIWDGTSWIGAQDAAIAAAQTTADGKNKIYRQGTTPTGTFSVGDLWFNTASDNVMSRWDGSTWISTTLGNNALYGNISANKLTSGSIDASVINVSNINAGNISTGYLAASRIQTGSLNASVITTGTITATQIATGTITATEISSSYVYAGTISASQITAGTLTGFLIQTSSSTTAVKIVGSTNSIDFINGGSTVGKIYPWSSNGIYMSYGSGSYPASYIGSSTAVIAGSSTIDIYSSSTGNGYDGTFTGYGDFNITSSYELRNPYSYNNTTTNAATVWVSSTGQYRRSTASSQRYKTDIVSLNDIPELNPQALYSLPVRAFRFKPEFLSENDDRANTLMPGFIAEEVDAIYPIAADYVDGVETWNERMVIPALLALVQEQNERIKILEGK